MPDDPTPAADKSDTWLPKMETEEEVDELCRVLAVLQQHGLDGDINIDKSSFEALRELVNPPKPGSSSKEEEAVVMPETARALPNQHRPEVEEPPTLVQDAAPRTTVKEEEDKEAPSSSEPPSDLHTSGRSAAAASTMDWRSINPPDGETLGEAIPQEASPVERRILQQLERQNALLLDLHRRLDQLELTTASSSNNTATTRSAAPRVAAPQLRPPAAQGQHAAPRVAAAAPARPPQGPNLLLQLWQALTGIPTYIKNSRPLEIWRVFWALHRREMGPFNGGFLLKLVVCAIIMSAKLSHKKQKKKNHKLGRLQFYVAACLVVVGWLLQSGYIAFVYNFCVKEKYPERIWNGEVIDVAAIPRNQHLQRRNDENPEQARPLRGLWAGGIAARPEGGILALLHDVVFLLLSFVLSIFPMWKPEGPPPPPPAEEGQEDEAAEEPPQHQEPGGLPAPGEPQRGVPDLPEADDDDEEEDDIYNHDD